MRMGEAVEQGEEVEQQLPGAEKNAEEPGVQQDEVLEIIRQIDTEAELSSMAEVPKEIQAKSITMETAAVNEPIEEAEQPILTPEEVAANSEASNPEAAETDMDVDENRTAGRDPIERVEKATDETLETREEEHPTKRVETSPAEGIATNKTAPENREVVIITDEEERTEKVVPRDEGARARAATVHFNQWRLDREETSRMRFTEEQPRETPEQRTGGDVNRPVKSVVGPPRRRRKLLIDEELEEESEMFLTFIDVQPSSGQQDPLA